MGLLTVWAFWPRGDRSPVVPIATDDRVQVVYEVDGSAPGADLTLSNGHGGTSQFNGVRLPVCPTAPAVTRTGEAGPGPGGCGIAFGVEPGAFLYVSAQNTGEEGTIHCRITADGETVDAATSAGAYAVASCSGTAP